jgi:hypothetical protein
MRTTLDIEDDVLQAAKEIARREGGTAGQVISRLARQGLSGSRVKKGRSPRVRAGVPLLPSRGEVVTLEDVEKLMDKEGV